MITVMAAVPAACRSVAEIAALSWVALTNVVGRFAPFQRTTELAAKFEPVAVSVKPAAPWAAPAGEIDASDGTGLFAGGGDALIRNDSDSDVPPPGPGLDTDTCAEPAVPMSAAVMAAVSCVALTKVVARSWAFQRTLDAPTKFDPVTVSEKVRPPAEALAGSMDATEGEGLLDCAPN